MTFHVGQRVVCIDADQRDVPGAVGNLDGLTKGRIYTVREVGLIAWPDGGPAILVAEIKRPILPGQVEECPYWAWRFRPLTERKTDISIFEKMLTDAPNEVEGVE